MLEFPKAKTAEEKVLLIYGILGTMPIVELFGFTAFTWLTLLVLCFVFINRRLNNGIDRKAFPFVAFMMLTFFSAVICILSDMDVMWKKLQLANVVWHVCYLLIFLGYFSPEGCRKCIFYIKGVYIASFIHAFWGLLQFGIYEIAHVAINKVLFHDIMHVARAEYVQMRGNSIAMTGLCWNVGNIALLLVIGYVFSPSIFAKLFFVAITFLSGSRTAITGIVVCVFLDIFLWFFRRAKGRVRAAYIVGFISLAAVCCVLVLTNGKMINSALDRLRNMQEMLSPDFLVTQSSARVHARYWTTIGMVTEWNDLIHNLFGYGIGASGYPFAILFEQYNDHAWTVECDFINNLWSFGYVGFFVWYGWYFVNIIKGIKLDKRLLVLFAGILIEGVTYNVTFNWGFMFLLFVFTHISYSECFLGNEQVSFSKAAGKLRNAFI